MSDIVILLMLISVLPSEQRPAAHAPSISRLNIQATSITEDDGLLKYIDNEVVPILSRNLHKPLLNITHHCVNKNAVKAKQVKAWLSVHAAETAKSCFDKLPSKQTEEQAYENLKKALDGLREQTHHHAIRLCATVSISKICREFEQQQNRNYSMYRNPKVEKCVERVRFLLSMAHSNVVG